MDRKGNEFEGGDDLDHVLEVVFDRPGGARRIERSIASYDAVLGPLFDDDEDEPLLRLLRTDWALCNGELDRPGDT